MGPLLLGLALSLLLALLKSSITRGRQRKRVRSRIASRAGNRGRSTPATTGFSRSTPSTEHAFGETSIRFSSRPSTSQSPTLSGVMLDGDPGPANREAL